MFRNELQHQLNMNNALSDSSSTLAEKGLTQREIDGLERFTFDPSLNNTEQDQCMVCLDEFQKGDDLRKLSCAHIFHCGCMDEWLLRSGICPLCKRNAVKSKPTFNQDQNQQSDSRSNDRNQTAQQQQGSQ
jgi:hypothetical protein